MSILSFNSINLRNQEVSTTSTYISNKERILFIGTRAKEYLLTTKNILKKASVKCDIILGEKIELTDSAPSVLISENEEFLDFHILFVGETDKSHIDTIRKLVATTPKGGSLVFCKGDKEIVQLCTLDREDIFILPYETKTTPEDTIKEGIKLLAYRLGAS